MIRIKRKLIRPLKPQFSLLLKKFLEPIKGFLPPCNLTAFDIKEAFSTGPGSLKEQTKTISEFRFNQRSEFWEVFWNQSLKAQLLMLSHLMASLTATKHGDCGISREADIKIFLCINLKHFFALLSIPSQRSSAWLAWKQIFRRNFIWEFQEKKNSSFQLQIQSNLRLLSAQVTKQRNWSLNPKFEPQVEICGKQGFTILANP